MTRRAELSCFVISIARLDSNLGEDERERPRYNTLALGLCEHFSATVYRSGLTPCSAAKAQINWL